MDIDYVSRRFAELARRNSVPGAQLALHCQGQDWTSEFGVAEHGTSRIVTPDSKVPIGSVTKTFTATLAMILVSDGDLELDAPLAGYLPELRSVGDGAAARLTLRQLLSHTGGLASDPDEVRTTSRRRHVLTCCQAFDLLYQPGTSFSYSNLGYVLAGHLIEVVTGMSWWEAMDAVLCKPLGIAPHFVVGPDDAPRAAGPVMTGHAVNPRLKRVRPVRQSLALADAPAGAVAASAADLIALGRLHLPGQANHLISPADLRQMHDPVPTAEPFGMADGWGLGLAMYRAGATTWLGHDGTADGTACHLRFDPVSGTVVALTTNGSTGFTMWRQLITELNLAGLPVANYDSCRRLTRRVSPPPDSVGRYVNGDIEYSVRMLGRDKLHLAVDGEPFAELTPYAGSVFAMRDVETGEDNQTGRFLPDPHTGEIRWIQIGGRLAKRSEGARVVA